jgi:hypothetical protein
MENETQKCLGCDAAFELSRAALSRYDNKTHICSQCGQLEAFIQFEAQRIGLDPQAALASPGRAAGMGIA